MNKNYFFFLLFISQTLFLSAQSSKQKKADRLFDDFAYAKAVDLYQDLLERGYNSDHNKRQLADSYLLLRDPENAVAYYEDVVAQPDVSPEYYFRYAQSLRGVRRYDESRIWLRKYQEEGKNSEHVNRMLSNDEINVYDTNQSFRLRPADMNSKFSDFGGYSVNGIVYFTSARGEGPRSNKIYDWNGEPFLDIYQVPEAGSEVIPLRGDVNTVRHEGPVSISADGKTMYFTRNNYMNRKNGKRDEQGINHLKIYKASLINNEWTDIEELPFNDNTYSVGHPALSPDGQILYFASDAPDGQGGTDLYKVEIQGDSYSTPENLGPQINTPGNEVFPFVAANNTFYFSSDGHKGYGLLDVFLVLPKDDLVQNMGEPVNSSHDDFSFSTSTGNEEGFVSSNRTGGIGGDDIYRINILAPLVLRGTATDSINNQPITNATIRLMDENNNQVAFLETDQDGTFQTKVSRDREYPIEAKHIKFDTKSDRISTSNMDDRIELVYNIELSPVNDVEYLAEINKIYFDFDKSDIRPDAAEELDKLVDLMLNDYPDLVIEIGSHTDTRGSAEYNRKLAERRAQATFDYLILKGVSENRIVTYKGYGEEEPDVDCTRCNEQDHQLNRRSIFKVVKME